MKLPFNLPPLSKDTPPPIWKKDSFYIEQERIKVLQYGQNLSGWNTDLTELHEEHTQTHFIDCASRKNTIRKVLKYQSSSPQPVILEVGCSSGYLLKELKQVLPSNTIILGADVVYEPLLKLYDEISEIPLFQFDLTSCPLPNESVDIVILLNVLEHIENDTLAIQQVYRILKKGGVMILELPAGPDLYDIYDKMLMHYKRYLLSGLEKQTNDCGFKTLEKSHLGFFLYPAFWITKKLNRLFYDVNSMNTTEVNKVLNNMKQGANHSILHWISNIELKLGEVFSYPFGTRCIMICRKF